MKNKTKRIAMSFKICAFAVMAALCVAGCEHGSKKKDSENKGAGTTQSTSDSLQDTMNQIKDIQKQIKEIKIPKPPCPMCGRTGGHDSSCPIRPK